MTEKMVYILSPVRGVTPEQSEVISRHTRLLQEQGVRVFNPVVDAPQQDQTGFNIVRAEVDFLNRMVGGGIVDILWNLEGKPSEGSRVDVGIALGLNLDMNLVHVFGRDHASSGPQVAYRIIREITDPLPEKPTAQTALELLAKMSQDEEATIDWNVDMTGEAEEWQRIRLGLALACLKQNPNFKIKMGTLIGMDPPDKKSYPKVISELKRRSSL